MDPIDRGGAGLHETVIKVKLARLQNKVGNIGLCLK